MAPTSTGIPVKEVPAPRRRADGVTQVSMRESAPHTPRPVRPRLRDAAAGEQQTVLCMIEDRDGVEMRTLVRELERIATRLGQAS